MVMQKKEFEDLINNYVENEDIIITNARGFWETAPRMKCLIMNTGLHILLKRDNLMTLKDKLESDILEEDKFYILQEFCADINMPDVKLIENIINKQNT